MVKTSSSNPGDAGSTVVYQTPVAHQAPLPIGFSRQEYLSGLPFSPPGNLFRDQTHISYISCIGRQVLYH